MIRHYRSTIFQIALEISRLCIVHILSTDKLHLFVKTPTYTFCIPIHPNLNESVKVRKFLGGGQSLMIKDLHRFIKHFVIKYHGII